MSMSKNPFINALAATTYITAVAWLMFYGSRMLEPVEESIFIPITILSLFVLSAAMMGYFFIFQPLRLFFEGKQKEAVKFFLSTIVIFAGITAVLVLLWFFLSAVL